MVLSSASLDVKVQRVAAETLVELHHVVHCVYQEMYRPCEGPRQLTVSYDGTWKRRGFQFLIGIGIVIETLTGLVLDCAVLCKYCIDCELVNKKLSGKELETGKQLQGGMCTINQVDQWRPSRPR